MEKLLNKILIVELLNKNLSIEDLSEKLIYLLFCHFFHENKIANEINRLKMFLLSHISYIYTSRSFNAFHIRSCSIFL